MLLIDDIEEVHITSLEGLGSSYRINGYFILKPDDDNQKLKLLFEGVVFGGTYGGHNVSVNMSKEERESLMSKKIGATEEELETLLTEVQRRLLNNEMIVDYGNLKPESREDIDGLNGI